MKHRKCKVCLPFWVILSLTECQSNCFTFLTGGYAFIRLVGMLYNGKGSKLDLAVKSTTIILAILVDLSSPMICAKIQPCSGEEDFWRFFNIYGHGGHLGQRTATIFAIFCSPNLRRPHMKFEQNRLSGFRGEVVWKCLRTDAWTDTRTDDGQKVIIIAHPRIQRRSLERADRIRKQSLNIKD